MKKIALGILAVLVLTACGGKDQAEEVAEIRVPQTLEEIIAGAKAEGQVTSVGMPGSWANWEGTWNDLGKLYGLSHSDTDMSSAEEIAKFKAEGKNATADIGDVGFEFGGIAVNEGVTQPYKPTTWDEIPEWAKDPEGHWMLAYTGTIAFIVDKTLVTDIPTSWNELLNESDAKITIGGVGIGTQPTSGVLAASLAFGGDESDLEPGYEYFKKIAEEGRLALNDPSIANLEKGEVEIGILWDFNALNYRDQIDRERFEVLIPSDGSLISGYTTIINKYAKNPNAARLAREYILSDAGQINLADGYAKPIRNVELPEEIAEKLIPTEQYVNVKPIRDFDVWSSTAKDVPMDWQERVLVYRK